MTGLLHSHQDPDRQRPLVQDSPGGLPCPAAAVAIAKAEAGDTEQWVLSATCPGYLKKERNGM